MDLPGADENFVKLKEYLGDITVFGVSAAAVQGLEPVLQRVLVMLESLPPIQRFEADYVEVDASKLAYEVKREDDVYYVSGTLVDHLMDSTYTNDIDSMNRFHKMLVKFGVIDALHKEGAQDGDTVSMDGREFDFVE
jgi:GTP-binding protein